MNIKLKKNGKDWYVSEDDDKPVCMGARLGIVYDVRGIRDKICRIVKYGNFNAVKHWFLDKVHDRNMRIILIRNDVTAEAIQEILMKDAFEEYELTTLSSNLVE